LIRGGEDYHQPSSEWTRVRINVLDEFRGQNVDWIAMDGNPREWAVAFHGIA
jgi:hypothetical protein